MCFLSFIRFVGFEGIAIILLMKLYLHQYSMTGLLIDVGGYPDSPEEGQKLDPWFLHKFPSSSGFYTC